MKNYLPYLVLLMLSSSVKAESLDPLDLKVEDLLNVEITSVSKKAQAMNDAAAAVFVITNEDIKRTGVTSVPEALRMAPGLDVARIDANKWAVSARGFNGRFANKLLVLIDGRNAYTRTFSGVYWENQDVMLEDVERIEVIRGPGATLWGSNAVNGVINIITKHSSKTQGGLLAGGGGTEEQGFGAFRYGGKLGEDTTGRVYAKGFQRDENTNLAGEGAGDDWDKAQGGFRIDSNLSLEDDLTVQGDVYHSNIKQTLRLPQTSAPFTGLYKDQAETYGGNLLSRLKHTFSTTSDYSLQLYYDYYKRNEAWFSEGRNTLDLDFQHRFALMERHEVIWGFGYQYTHDTTRAGKLVSFNPNSRKDQLFSGFVQDEIELIDHSLWLTLGTKLEHNDYSGFEGQPTARVMWAPHAQHRLWGAVSRAVRTPSRSEHNMTLLNEVKPLPFPAPFDKTRIEMQGNTKFDSESVITYELGYRTTFIKSLSLDVTAFYSDYENLRFLETPQEDTPLSFRDGMLVTSLALTNDYKAKSYGVETATVWQMLDWWYSGPQISDSGLRWCRIT